MNPKTTLKTLAFLPLLLGAAGSLHATSPLLDLGDGAVAYFLCDAGVTYNDNIYSRSNKTDDLILNLAPGFELIVGKESNNQLKVVAKENLLLYTDESDLNDQLANVDVSYVYDPGRALTVKAGAGFHQLNQNTNTIGQYGEPQLIKRDTYDANILVDYKVTAKSIIETGFFYNATNYTKFRNQYNDQATYSVPLRWYYQMTDKLFAGLVYSYSYTDIDGCDVVKRPGNQQVHFAGLTARGELTSKISISADAGAGYSQYKDREYEFLFPGSGVWVSDDRNDTTFNFVLKADYQASEKLSFHLRGGRSFNVGGQAQAYTNTFADLRGVYAINHHWQASANLGYSYQDFEASGASRAGTDKITTCGASISYLPNHYWRISLTYSFYYDDSDRIDNYNNNTLALTASLKY